MFAHRDSLCWFTAAKRVTRSDLFGCKNRFCCHVPCNKKSRLCHGGLPTTQVSFTQVPLSHVSVFSAPSCVVVFSNYLLKPSRPGSCPTTACFKTLHLVAQKNILSARLNLCEMTSWYICQILSASKEAPHSQIYTF